jgi:predicted small lipoprotein YifL
MKVQMKKILLLAVLSSFVMLTGCVATGPLYKDHPDSKAVVPADQSRLLFFRNPGYVATALDARIAIDDKQVAAVTNGSFKSVLVASGKHKITVDASITPGVCNLEIETVAGKTHYLQIGTSTSTNLALDLVGLSKVNPNLLPCLGQFRLHVVTEESSKPFLEKLGAAQ